jgi:SAM-dependent methyltransferase
MAEVPQQMRADWNARAKEDAGYYVAFGARDQDNEAFFATGADTVRGLETELRRDDAAKWAAGRALEIGCGPGRLLRPLSRHFAEIHGIDVADEMIALARQNLAGVDHAHVHVGDGAKLTQFADASIDFVYSYAVFQHIPSRDVVLEYLAEVDRVLRPGGLARLQLNGLPRTDDWYTTWSGARFAASEIVEFTRTRDMQVLSLEGAGTQYMWTAWRKRESGWSRTQAARTFAEPVARIRRTTNACSSEPFATTHGRFASISIWCENLPEAAGLHHLRVKIADFDGEVIFVGPKDHAGLQQVTVLLPMLQQTGLLPVAMLWNDSPLTPHATLRVVPPGPVVPRLRALSDGVNLVAGTRIETRTVKMTLEDVANPQEIAATIAGVPVADLEHFCIDPRQSLYEVNFRLPDALPPGPYNLDITLGKRKLAPVGLHVVA